MRPTFLPLATCPCPDIPSGPEGARDLNQQAIACLMRGDVEGSLAGFRAAAEMDDRYPEPWNNSGLVRQRLGRLAEAEADFERALDLRPDYAEALTNRGRLRQQRGDLDSARADFDRALDCAEGRFAASVLHNRGALRQVMGDLAGALADFDRALEVDPDHVATLANRGMARKEAGDLEGARADLDLALERMAPQHRPAILHKRGGVRVLQSDFRGAVDDYNEALAAEPDNVIYYISRGNARYHLRDVGALRDYRTAFRLDAELAGREVARMVADDAARDLQNVVENCSKHLRINPRDALALVRRGLTLLLNGQGDEAVADLEAGALLHPDYRPILERAVAHVLAHAEGDTIRNAHCAS
jgi:tetratricopeptide (TPR) repeat protein